MKVSSKAILLTLALMQSSVFADSAIQKAMQSVVGVYVEYPNTNPYGAPQQGFGSGVIISDTGHIVTNNHVTNQATSITIITNDGSRSHATVVGDAPEFDISVLQIKNPSKTPYQSISFGSSSQISVGDSVTAIGNPFGFEQTVTQGIVSNLHRDVFGGSIHDYLQVDAAVNPGHSGGALINKEGKLVGINKGLYGPQFNIGIAFAIPVDHVRPVIEQIMNSGHAGRGWIGVETQPMTPELKQAFRASNQDGVLVSQVIPGSPAHRANLQPKDIIVEVNNAPIASPAHLSSIIAVQGDNHMINMSYLRENKTFTTRFKTEGPKPYQDPRADRSGLKVEGYDEANLSGHRISGVRIVQVNPGSTAALNGLTPGDIIISVNNQHIQSLNDIEKNQFGSSDSSLLEIKRGDHIFFTAFRL